MGQLINLGKENVIPITLNYRKAKNATVYTSLTQILSVNGSGFVKSAFNINLATSGASYAQIKITVDDVVVLDVNNTAPELTTRCCHGFSDYSNDYSLPSIAVTSIINGGSTTAHELSFPLATTQTGGSYGGFFVLPELIRFEKSFVVEVKKETVDINTIIEYYLD